MAEIHPFRALRYNPSRVRLADVLTQPYDKITPAMQERYYAASPGNLVRIVLGRREPGDSENDNVYTRAAAYFSDWRRNRIFLADDEPSIYAYAQRFFLPGATGREYERRGFIALGKLEDYATGVVFRHEETFSAPKADRLKLLDATRAHFEQLFMVYDDPQRAVDSVLLTATAAAPADIDVNDEYGVRHQVWKVSQPEVIRQVQAAMCGKKLIIADGHHRYETALTYRDERRQAEGSSRPDAPFERVVMTFVNMAAEGLTILPTHRVVFGRTGFDVVRMVERARPFFQVNPLRERVDVATAARLLEQAGGDSTTFIAITPTGDFIFQARPEADAAPGLAALSPRQRRLDVAKLHKIVLEDVLSISAADIRAQTYINYLRDTGEAIERVRHGGANVAFLMNPVPVGQMRDVAFAGEVMPQKSTDFYPKLLSGLTVYALE
jgi:uncharacterized protein (DUF1015 family)